jgi:hypothetical protein
MFDPQWDQQMYEVALEAENPGWQDPPLMAYLLRNELVELEQLPAAWEWSLGFRAFGETVPGPVLLDVEELLGEVQEDGSAGRIAAAFGASVRVGLPRVDGRFLRAAFARLDEGISPAAPDRLAAATENRDIREALIWACCALFEVTAPAYHPFHKHVDFVLGRPWFDRVAATRAKGPGRTVISGAEPFSLKELHSLQGSGTVPGWFLDWCTGQRSLLIELVSRPAPGVRTRRPAQPGTHH